ncbi:MAG: ImmA/IrrE family metallo-endopeptidase [Bradyrhizobium sp.]|uniref:ImmA/IrrE family metallo-endopeptidase n=1 Tax=Bradyrhizobium sp. TaxID=376 RepID=UPI0012059843|nr:ImmA/IrrE family metallo-endopeptidase [Bradyrhizobium sp.]THD64184.1 MAG: ImmA/IrrE family metallo-endopeptidase [Bradyrhizobium sp.]
MNEKAFEPDWLSAPGGTILDAIEERGMSSKELAALLGYSIDKTEKLIAGKETITRDVAALLAEHVGGVVKFWLSRERNYRSEVARLQTAGNIIAGKAWLDELPLKDMQKFGWVPQHASVEENVASCLNFFGVRNVQEWRSQYSQFLSLVSFRTSPTHKSEPGAVIAWLRYGELKSEAIACGAWNAASFERSLISMRRLTRKKDPSIFIPELRKLCAENGVALVVARGPAGCRASGATRFLSNRKAMILSSFRHLADDQFWFTFFHEAGHLLMHGQKSIFLEDGSEVSLKEEHEANLFSQNILIPPESRAEFMSLKPNKDSIIKFAVKIGISRGIVVGQLQHQRRIEPSQLNFLKRRYDVEDLNKLT